MQYSQGLFDNPIKIWNGVRKKKKKKKGKASKFVDAGRNFQNQREGSWQHQMDRQEKMEKNNKIKNVGTERSENIDTFQLTN